MSTRKSLSVGSIYYEKTISQRGSPGIGVLMWTKDGSLRLCSVVEVANMKTMF